MKKLHPDEEYDEGYVAIWWYTDNNEFWDFSTTLDNAEEDYGYLQYSKTKNHLNLWKTAVETFVTNKEEQKKVYEKGYKSIERGRVIYNIRTHCYEIICSEELLHNETFRKNCLNYFNLIGNRVDFQALNHYKKISLTGNPAVDSLYYED